MAKTISTRNITTVEELIDALRDMQDLSDTLEGNTVIYPQDRDGKSFSTVRLIEDILTDGSRVFNVEFE